MAGQIERKYLAGLKFRTSQPKEVVENGKKRTINLPVERDLTPDDVLSWKDAGSEVIIVAGDGAKYTVKKGGSGKAEGGEKEKK